MNTISNDVMSPSPATTREDYSLQIGYLDSILFWSYSLKLSNLTADVCVGEDRKEILILEYEGKRKIGKFVLPFEECGLYARDWRRIIAKYIHSLRRKVRDAEKCH